jgi:hypothetical protein
MKFEILRAFHQFLAGPDKSDLLKFQVEYNVKIHMAPFDMDQASSGKNLDELILTGLQEDCNKCKAHLIKLYELVVSS